MRPLISPRLQPVAPTPVVLAHGAVCRQSALGYGKDLHHRVLGDRDGIDVADDGERDLARVQRRKIDRVVAHAVTRDDLQPSSLRAPSRRTVAGCAGSARRPWQRAGHRRTQTPLRRSRKCSRRRAHARAGRDRRGAVCRQPKYAASVALPPPFSTVFARLLAGEFAPARWSKLAAAAPPEGGNRRRPLSCRSPSRWPWQRIQGCRNAGQP